MTTTRRTGLTSRTTTPDDSGRKFLASPALTHAETTPGTGHRAARPLPSLSWRLRH